MPSFFFIEIYVRDYYIGNKDEPSGEYRKEDMYD